MIDDQRFGAASGILCLMFRGGGPNVCLVGALCALSALSQAPAVFQGGTRLVEVEVVVRDRSGPVKGLSKDEFTLLDEGKPQRIAIFRDASRTENIVAALPPGTVSNRTDSRGQPLNGATVVLLDQLNTRFDLKGYERTRMIKMLHSLAGGDRIAVYALGKSLHILQDFTDDPGKLIEAVARMDHGLDLLPTDFDDLLQEISDGSESGDGEKRVASVEAQVYADIHDQITVDALNRIMLHLSGVPGRKNLIWLKEYPVVPPAVMAMAQRANVALYPVLVRSVLLSIRDIFGLQHAVEKLGEATGGAGFVDAGDLTTAVHTAEDDSRSAYVLAYYPSEDMLDGRFHRLTVKVDKRQYEVRYRPGYFASKSAVPVPIPPDQDQFANPLDLTAIGLTAQVRADPGTPEGREIHVTVDLHDLHLERQKGWFTGAFKLSLLFPGTDSIRSWTFPLSLPEEQLEAALRSGYTLDAKGIPREVGEVRIVVRDLATAATGSLRVPVAKQ